MNEGKSIVKGSEEIPNVNEESQVLERIVIDEDNTLDNPETKNVENEERTN